jgi:hypothetical protein
MSLGSAIGQVDSGIFNDLLNAPHFVDITLSPVKYAPREGAIAYDEKTQLLYYSRQYKWIPITAGFPIGGIPQGIVVQNTAPTGTTFTGVTIVSGNSSITVTNGNGVGGNPTITFNGQTFPQGMLAQTTGPSGTTVVGRTITSSTTAITILNGNGVGGNPTLTFNPTMAGITALDVSITPTTIFAGPTVQDVINQLTNQFSTNNGFSAIVPANQVIGPVAADNVDFTSAGSTGYFGTGYSGIVSPSLYTVPTTGVYANFLSLTLTSSVGGGTLAVLVNTGVPNTVIWQSQPLPVGLSYWFPNSNDLLQVGWIVGISITPGGGGDVVTVLGSAITTFSRWGMRQI